MGIARTQLAVAEAAPVPDVTLQFVGSYDSIGQFGKFNSLVALPLPIFNRNQGGIHLATSEILRSEKELERTRLVMQDLVATSYRDYVLARHQVRELRDEILPRLKENLDLTIKGYRQGEFNFLAVLNAQQSNFKTHLEYIDALSRARQRGRNRGLTPCRRSQPGHNWDGDSGDRRGRTDLRRSTTPPAAKRRNSGHFRSDHASMMRIANETGDCPCRAPRPEPRTMSVSHKEPHIWG